MLKSLSKLPLIAMALVACAAQAQTTGRPGCLTFGEQQPVRSAHGDCWRAGDSSIYTAQVLFAFERAELDAQGRKVLDELAQRLLAMDAAAVTGTAHADRIGEETYNERLSGRRAEAIRAYLVEKGVSEKRLRLDSKGTREPLTAGHCDAMGPERKHNGKLVACLQPDRRVELQVIGLTRSRTAW